MEDRGEGRNRLLVIMLIAIVIGGTWWLLRRPSAHAALESAADVIAPTPQTMQRNLDVIDQARQVTDQINARQHAGEH